ncbi:MAG: RluA family pseudouridine synthase [Spirochaetales bacterium]|nr:RluA family pseudouridine synthase [Spirochaetales bacterium]MCF7937153.1 RluA family pseudouridine synthase [Spirochaetales bacterium]
MGKKNQQLHLTAGENDAGRRLDRILRRYLDTLPLSAVYRLIRRGDIRVNGNRIKSSYRLHRGDTIGISGLPPQEAASLQTSDNQTEGQPSPSPSLSEAEQLDRKRILFESPNIIAVNKPRGIPVHGNGGLDRMVAAYLSKVLEASIGFRPGPLHRLDRNTSGVILFSRSIEGARRASELFRSGGFIKRYIGLAEGRCGKHEFWEDRIERSGERRTSRVLPDHIADTPAGGPLSADVPSDSGGKGRIARTSVRTLVSGEFSGKKYSLLEYTIETGLTHQIRVQSSAHALPLAEDRKYGGNPLPHHKGSPAAGGKTGYFLHALKLSLSVEEPVLGFRSLTAPIPADFQKILTRLFKLRDLEQAGFPFFS